MSSRNSAPCLHATQLRTGCFTKLEADGVLSFRSRPVGSAPVAVPAAAPDHQGDTGRGESGAHGAEGEERGAVGAGPGEVTAGPGTGPAAPVRSVGTAVTLAGRGAGPVPGRSRRAVAGGALRRPPRTARRPRRSRHSALTPRRPGGGGAVGDGAARSRRREGEDEGAGGAAGQEERAPQPTCSCPPAVTTIHSSPLHQHPFHAFYTSCHDLETRDLPPVPGAATPHPPLSAPATRACPTA